MAAFLHDIASTWPAAKVADAANRAGAQAVCGAGVIPAWARQDQVQP
jgi:sugar/nucleoside kinase (ribokinase family)